jgi:hypothetical protein
VAADVGYGLIDSSSWKMVPSFRRPSRAYTSVLRAELMAALHEEMCRQRTEAAARRPRGRRSHHYGEEETLSTSGKGSGGMRTSRWWCVRASNNGSGHEWCHWPSATVGRASAPPAKRVVGEGPCDGALRQGKGGALMVELRQWISDSRRRLAGLIIPPTYTQREAKK